MKLRIPGRILLATLPATAAVLALTTGTASALPRNPCEDYANQVNHYYSNYQYWSGLTDAALDAGNMDLAFHDAEIAINYRESYESALTNAYNYGCF
jgi:hypothetical protein